MRSRSDPNRRETRLKVRESKLKVDESTGQHIALSQHAALLLRDVGRLLLVAYFRCISMPSLLQLEIRDAIHWHEKNRYWQHWLVNYIAVNDAAATTLRPCSFFD